jgi:hypothetical protein
MFPSRRTGQEGNAQAVHIWLRDRRISAGHESKRAGAVTVVIWGIAAPRIDFLHVDAMAAACVHVVELDHAPYAAHTKLVQSHIIDVRQNVIGTECCV